MCLSDIWATARQHLTLEDNSYIYSYDKNGNTISKTNKATNGYTRYYWDAENQMTKLEKYAQAGDATPTSIVSYIYDGFGRRVAKNVGGTVTKYLYDQEDILLEMDVNDAMQARYTHGPGIDEPISMDRGGSSYYYIADALGSIAKVVDSVGNVINRYVYNSFGSIVEKVEGVANAYTYTGREYDPESGLYYYRNRYYNAKIGRFLSEDPSHYPHTPQDNIPYLLPALLNIPQELHLYVYALNNPVDRIDPFGLWSKCKLECFVGLTIRALKDAGVNMGLIKFCSILVHPVAIISCLASVIGYDIYEAWDMLTGFKKCVQKCDGNGKPKCSNSQSPQLTLRSL